MVKYIVVAGGVISGVGKGVATASLGKILQAYGYKATAIKIDPYLNCDAGTLRPTEHGEVWVTDDGGEIDQDLGNYERFLGQDIPKRNNITSGQIYKALIEKERRGEFLGETVQFIPHVPDEIKSRIKKASEGFDIALVEIGGTVGDYENIPFLFAMKSLESEIGRENIIYILVSYLPIPSHIDEMKTKPTQLAVKLMRESGIQPDLIFCRGKNVLDEPRKKKLEMYANIKSEDIISMPDVIGRGTVNTIYIIPLNLEKENLGVKIMKKLGLWPKVKPNWGEWERLVNEIINPQKRVTVAMVGKYLDIGSYTLTDSYISINQALVHAGASLGCGIDIKWVDAKQLDLNVLKQCDGLLVPGGFGCSGVEGKIDAIRFARENNIPFLGLCYGMQLAVIEYARNVCGMKGANTIEVDSETKYSVVDILKAQKKLLENREFGASMRLGAYAAELNAKSLVYGLYKKAGRIEKDKKIFGAMADDFRKGGLKGKNIVVERHRHRYEVSPKYAGVLEKKGIFFSGVHVRRDGARLMEFMELKNHPFFVATQAHPEFKSRLNDPAPLFCGFVGACIKRKEETEGKYV
jgi:CTP synthase